MIRNSKILSGTGQSGPIRVDPNTVTLSALAQLIFTGVATATVQYTPDKPDMTNTTDNWAAARWFDVDQLDALSINTGALVDTPAEGLRLDVTAFTSGTVELKVVQGYRV